MSYYQQAFWKPFATLLRNIFLNNENYSIFLNTITLGAIESGGVYNPKAKINFSKEISDTSFVDSPYRRCPTSIRVCEFSIKAINECSIYGTGDLDNPMRGSKFYYTNLYNRRLENKRKHGLNLCRSAKLKGYLLNFIDVKDLIDFAKSQDNYNNTLTHINEFYYVGQRNALLAFTTANGLLYIREKTLEKLIKENEISVVEKVLKNLITCYYQFIKKFISYNIDDLEKDLIEIAYEDVFTKIISGEPVNEKYYSSYYKQDTRLKDYNFLSKAIKEQVKDVVKQNLGGSVFGADNMYSFNNILQEIMNSRKEQERVSFKEGFGKGMQMGLKLEMLGWRMAEKNFADETLAGMWWWKDVDIHPSTFMYAGERYTIPEDKRKMFHITKLYVNHRGVMRSEGNHPNTRGGRVCMGDLQIKFDENFSNAAEVLKAAEDLLDMINYDSAYDTKGRDELLKVSTKQSVLGTGAVKITKKSGIQELGSSDFDAAEDESKETPVHVIKQIKDKGQVIATIESLPADTSRDERGPIMGRRSISNTEDVFRTETEKLEFVDTPENHQAVEVLQNITALDADGNLSVPVHIMPGVVVTNNSGYVYSIGDEDIVR